MKSPKEKAIELVDKFTNIGLQRRNEGIACALIAVDEIIKALRKDLPELSLGKGYWSSVKKEIEKL
jgi:hypothetical protein